MAVVSFAVPPVSVPKVLDLNLSAVGRPRSNSLVEPQSARGLDSPLRNRNLVTTPGRPPGSPGRLNGDSSRASPRTGQLTHKLSLDQLLPATTPELVSRRQQILTFILFLRLYLSADVSHLKGHLGCAMENPSYKNQIFSLFLEKTTGIDEMVQKRFQTLVKARDAYAEPKQGTEPAALQSQRDAYHIELGRFQEFYAGIIEKIDQEYSISFTPPPLDIPSEWMKDESIFKGPMTLRQKIIQEILRRFPFTPEEAGESAETLEEKLFSKQMSDYTIFTRFVEGNESQRTREGAFYSLVNTVFTKHMGAADPTCQKLSSIQRRMTVNLGNCNAHLKSMRAINFLILNLFKQASFYNNILNFSSVILVEKSKTPKGGSIRGFEDFKVNPDIVEDLGRHDLPEFPVLEASVFGDCHEAAMNYHATSRRIKALLQEISEQVIKLYGEEKVVEGQRFKEPQDLQVLEVLDRFKFMHSYFASHITFLEMLIPSLKQDA